MKNWIIGTIVVFIAWMGLDFLFHGNLMMSMYQASAELWRPRAEAKMGLNTLVVFIAAAMFTAVYVYLVADKGIKTGALYGLLFGIGIGVSMGFGTYAFTPIPYEIALSWFSVTVVEATVAGVLLGLVTSK